MTLSTKKKAIQACINALEQAQNNNQPLCIVGSASKLGKMQRSSSCHLLRMDEFAGVINYEPSELFVTAMAGTTMRHISAILARQGQRLAFDAPQQQGTLGGVVATAASGPASHRLGRVRDAMLGVEMVNGLGQALKFGGELMKNVAGFDIARLNCGAYGKLGPIVAVTLRVCPAAEKTLNFVTAECPADKALEHILQQGKINAVAAASWVDGRVYVRLEGTANLLDSLQHDYHGWSKIQANQTLWQRLAKQEFSQMSDRHHMIVSMTCQPDTPINCLPDAELFCLDQGAALRWYKLPINQNLRMLSQDMFRRLAEQGVELVRYHQSRMPLGNMAAIYEPTAKLQRRVLAAFDPQGICNPDLTWNGL